MERLSSSFLIAVAAAIAMPVLAAGPGHELCSVDLPAQCLDGVSASVTSLDALRVSGAGIVQRSRDATDDERGQKNVAAGIAGMSSGDVFSGWNVWVSGSFSGFESDGIVAPYEADLFSLLAGADTMLSDRAVAGIAIGYENLDADTRFNGGGQEMDGFTIAPYVSYLLTDTFSIDFAGGYSWLDVEQERIDPAGTPGTATILRAAFDAERWFVTGNINATQVVGHWILGARAGILMTRETQDGYTETGGPSVRTVLERRPDLKQAVIGIDAAYSRGQWEPYVLAAWRRDLSREDGSGAGGLPGAVGSTQPDDDTEGELGLGVRFFGSDGTSGNFEWVHTIGRQDFANDTLSLFIRIDR